MADRNPPNPQLTAKQAVLARIDAAIARADANVQLALDQLAVSNRRYDNAPAENDKRELLNVLGMAQKQLGQAQERLDMFYQDRRRAAVGKHISPVGLIEPFCQERLDMFYQDRRGAAVGKHFFPGWSN